MNKKIILMIVLCLLLIVPTIKANHCKAGEKTCIENEGKVYDFIANPPGTWTTQQIAQLRAHDPDAARDAVAQRDRELKDNNKLDIFDEVLDDDEISFEDEEVKQIAYIYLLSEEPKENGKVIVRSTKSRKIFREYSKAVTKREVKIAKSFKGSVKAVENGFDIQEQSPGGNRKFSTNQMQPGSSIDVEAGKIVIAEPAQPDVEIGKEQPTVTTVTGDWDGELYKEGNSYTITNGDNQYYMQKINGIDNTINIDSRGTISIDGHTPEFVAFVNGDIHSFNNLQGTAKVTSQGAVSANNAKYKVTYGDEKRIEIAREIDGNFECSPTVCTLQSFGGRDTLFNSINKEGAISVNSQGNRVAVSIGGTPPDFPIDKLGSVWISEDAKSIESRGRVLTFHQKIIAGLIVGEDYTKASWRGFTSNSHFTQITDSAGRSAFKIQGAGLYNDVAKSLRTQSGVELSQSFSADPTRLDLLNIKCVHCQTDTESVLLSVKLVASSTNNQRQFHNSFTGETTTVHLGAKSSNTALDISFVANEQGELFPQLPANLGHLSENNDLYQIKNIVVNLGERNFALLDGRFGVFEIKTEHEFKPQIGLDLGIKGLLGAPSLQTLTEVEEFNNFVDIYNTAVSSGDLSQLPKITQDENVRKVVLQSMGIDLKLLSTNPRYARGIIQGNKLHQETIPVLLAELSSLGFDFDSNGNCISPTDCVARLIDESRSGTKVSSAHAELRQILSKINKQLLQAEKIKANAEGKDTSSIDSLLVQESAQLGIENKRLEYYNLMRTTQDELHPEERELIQQAENIGSQIRIHLKSIELTTGDYNSIISKIEKIKRGLAIDAGQFHATTESERNAASAKYDRLLAQTPELIPLENRKITLEQGAIAAKDRIEQLRNKFLQLTEHQNAEYIRAHLLRSTGISAYVELARKQEDHNRDDLAAHNYHLSDAAIEYQLAKEAWDLATLGDVNTARHLVNALDQNLPGVAWVKSEYQCRIGGLCQVAQDRAQEENIVSRHNLELQRSDEDSFLDKVLTKTGIVGLVGLGAHLHNFFAENDIVIPEESGEGLLVSPIGTTLDLIGSGTDLITDDILGIWDPYESDYERNSEALIYHRQRATEIAQLQTLLATGVSLKNLPQSDYVKSAHFSCTFYGKNCHQANVERLELNAKFHPDGASIIYEDMQQLASQGNKHAQEWLNENTAAVGLSRLSKGIVLSADIIAPFALAKLSLPSKLVKLRQLHAAIDAVDYGAALEVANVVKPSLTSRLLQKPVANVASVINKITPEGGAVRNYAGKIASLRVTKQPGYKQAIAVLEAEEEARLRMQILGKLWNQKSTNSAQIAKRRQLIQSMGLTEAELEGAIGNSIDSFIIAQGKTEEVLSYFKGQDYEDRLLRLNEFDDSLHPKATQDTIEATLSPAQEPTLSAAIEGQAQAVLVTQQEQGQAVFELLNNHVDDFSDALRNNPNLEKTENMLSGINVLEERIRSNPYLPLDKKNELVLRAQQQRLLLQDRMLNVLEQELNQVPNMQTTSQPLENLENLLLEVETLEWKAKQLSASHHDQFATLMRPLEQSLEQRLQALTQSSSTTVTGKDPSNLPTADLLSLQGLEQRTTRLVDTVADIQYTDDDIFAYSNSLLLRLRSRGDTTDTLYTVRSRGIQAYRQTITARNSYLDYIDTIDRRFPPETIKIHLGTDGIEYTNYAYRLATNNVEPNSVPHYISRRTLATKEEAENILAQAHNYKSGVEGAVGIGKGNVRLYEDVNTAILDAHDVHVGTGGTKHFDGALARRFDSNVMTVNQNRDKVVELVSQLRNSLVSAGKDVDNNLVLTDFAGRAHVQAFTLRNGIHWLSDEQNWASLTDAQRTSLGVSRNKFTNSKIDLHVGVVDSGVTTRNPLSGLDLPEVFEFPKVDDVVEQFRGVALNDQSLVTDSLVFQPTTPSEQAQTLSRQLIIADEIGKRKALLPIAFEDTLVPVPIAP